MAISSAGTVEETDPHLTTASFQGTPESYGITPKPPLLATKQTQLPQPLLITYVL